ncbi:hypothetical protein CRUP_037910 [Coryphaenoides rupestris]|nr:hypothetical protein CRUP_037910 [Coryphaenoides rupestris]
MFQQISSLSCSIINASMFGRTSTVVSERHGSSVVAVAINRPQVRNAVDQATARRLLEELEAFEADDQLSVAVLHGQGGNFCAGYDLKELANHTAALKLDQDVNKTPGPMGPSRLHLSKPLIAAVSGYAVAGGLELALLADLRVVEESAVMGVFCRRFAVAWADATAAAAATTTTTTTTPACLPPPPTQRCYVFVSRSARYI